MTTQLMIKRANQILFIVLIAVCCGATLSPALVQGQAQAKAKGQYQVSSLPTLGGTNSAGNSINLATSATMKP